MHGVVAPAVTAAFHLLKEFGIAIDIVADHEKCCLDTIAVERVENPRSHFRHGAVVESEVDHFLPSSFDSPDGLGKKKAVEQRWTFD